LVFGSHISIKTASRKRQPFIRTCAWMVTITSPNKTVKRIPRSLGRRRWVRIGVHIVAASDVEMLVLEHCNYPWKSLTQHPPLPPGHFPMKICGSHKARTTYTILFQKQRFQIFQFPAVPRFAQTGHSAQGQTVPNGIVMGPPLRDHKYGLTGWIYVLITRPPSLQDLYTLEPLSEDMTKWKPRQDVKDHIAYLETLRDSTIARVDDFLERKPVPMARQSCQKEVIKQQPPGKPFFRCPPLCIFLSSTMFMNAVLQSMMCIL
jgi:hypothetical protein